MPECSCSKNRDFVTAREQLPQSWGRGSPGQAGHLPVCSGPAPGAAWPRGGVPAHWMGFSSFTQTILGCFHKKIPRAEV